MMTTSRRTIYNKYDDLYIAQHPITFYKNIFDNITFTIRQLYIIITNNKEQTLLSDFSLNLMFIWALMATL